MTRAGFRQVLRQFLAASMCAVTGSSFHIGTSSGHLQQRRRRIRHNKVVVTERNIFVVTSLRRP